MTCARVATTTVMSRDAVIPTATWSPASAASITQPNRLGHRGRSTSTTARIRGADRAGPSAAMMTCAPAGIRARTRSRGGVAGWWHAALPTSTSAHTAREDILHL